MKSTANNYAFIDSQNLYHGVKTQGWKINFPRFLIFLREKYNVTRAFLFIGYVEGNQNLYTMLQKAGFICIFKPTIEIRRGDAIEHKGNIDAELVLHSMIEFANYRQAVIVSGDGDYYCLIEYLESQNKLLKIIVPSNRYSSLLRRFSGFIANINLFREKIELRRS